MLLTSKITLTVTSCKYLNLPPFCFTFVNSAFLHRTIDKTTVAYKYNARHSGEMRGAPAKATAI